MTELELQTFGGNTVMQFGPWVAVLRPDEFAFKGFGSEARAEKAVASLESSDGDPRVLGMGRSVVPLSALTSITMIPESGTIMIRWGSMWSPRSNLLKAGGGISFEPFYERVRTKYADRLSETTSTAGITDIPADPQLAVAVILATLGTACLIAGAFSRENVQPRGLFSFLAKIGQLIGTVPSLIIGAPVVMCGIAVLIRWIVNRPEKHELTRIN